MAAKYTAYQNEILSSDYFFNCAVWGRQTGKTETALALADKHIREGPVALIYPTEKMRQNAWTRYNGNTSIVKHHPGYTVTFQLEQLSPARTEFRSKIFEGYRAVIIDEAGLFTPEQLETLVSRLTGVERVYIFGTPVTLRQPTQHKSYFEKLATGDIRLMDYFARSRAADLSHVTTFESPFATPDPALLHPIRLKTDFLALFVDRSQYV